LTTSQAKPISQQQEEATRSHSLLHHVFQIQFVPGGKKKEMEGRKLLSRPQLRKCLVLHFLFIC